MTFIEKIDFHKIKYKWIIKKIENKKIWDEIHKEIILTAWHPNRLFDWCLPFNYYL